MVKVSAISDLHWEGREISKKDIDNGVGEGDIYILAGDITTTKSVRYGRSEKLRYLLDVIKERYRSAVAVPGNHESYHTEYATTLSVLEKFYEEHGVWFLNNQWLEVEGTTIFGGALGSNFHIDGSKYAANLYINDYRFINHNGVAWSTDDTLKQYEDFMSNLKFFGTTDIVVSHFSPSMQSSKPKWDGEMLNAYFHNNLDSFIEEHGPKLWVHGHTHDPSDYMIGDTRIYCNPRGYPSEGNELKLGEILNVD